MTYKMRLFYIAIGFFFLWFTDAVISERLYSLENTIPPYVVLSGVFQPEDGRVFDGAYEATLDFFNNDQSIPTISIQETIAIDQNYFRVVVDLSVFFFPLFKEKKPMFVTLSIGDDASITLPFASVPTVIKSGFSMQSNAMMDDQVFFPDYKQGRIGIGTDSPVSTVHVVGTVNATEYVYGDGSGLYNLPHSGSDNYNFLTSQNGEFVVVTVNVAGKMMIGARENIDRPDAAFQVYGSLLVESNDAVTSDIIAGAGPRWMWYADRSILRIGYTPSTYWDDAFSGDNSIAFGYANKAVGDYSIITGGFRNEVVTRDSIVSGGSENVVYGIDSIILGGRKNKINSASTGVPDNNSSVVLGGYKNAARNHAIVLGGFDNFSTGDYSVISGYNNVTLAERSLILGGMKNFNYSPKSMLMGSNILVATENAQGFTIGLTNFKTFSSASKNIKIDAPNGVGIGTNDTLSADLTVNGAVTANVYYGDGSLLTNIKEPLSAWQLHPMRLDLLVYENHLGVGTSNLLESLNVSGSIQLSGEASPDHGTIRYFEDTFSVYKDGLGWVTLQMEDTDTTYNAKESMVLDTDELTFYVSTQDAIVGQVKRWNGMFWEHGFLDQFVEEAESHRLLDLSLPKRLYLPTSHVAINAQGPMIDSDIVSAPFSVFTDAQNTSALYLYSRDGEDEKAISISTEPPGLHFQGRYMNRRYQPVSVGGAGMVLGDSVNPEGLQNSLIFYVNPTGTQSDVLMFSDQNIDIVGIEPADTDYSFYVGGDVSSKSFVFRSDQFGAGLYLRSPLFELNQPEYAVILSQLDNGELFIQPADTRGSVIFRQAGEQVALLRYDRLGHSYFGLSPQLPRSGLDVFNGHVHVSDGYGIAFNHHSENRSGIIFDSTRDDRITLHTSAELTIPNFMISNVANVDINGANNNGHDLFINNVEGRSTLVQLDTIDGQHPGLFFHVDGVQGVANDDGFLDRGEKYSVQMDDDDLVLKEDFSEVEAMTIHQDKFIGLYDATPTVALSVGADMVLLNQKGIYFKEVDGSAGPAIVMTDDEVSIKTSSETKIVDEQSDTAISVGPLGVGLHRTTVKDVIERTNIGFEVDGSMTVSGDIYNTLDDKIFPLDVQNFYQTKVERTVNNIKIDTDSGLSLDGDNISTSKLTVKGQGFYSRVKLPPCTPGPNNQTCLTDQLPNRIFDAATSNIGLRFIGRGITITANNRESRGLVTDVPSSLDTFNIINDLLAGGEITGPLTVKGTFVVLNQMRGNALGLRNIPFHWQHVRRNDPTEPKGLPYREPVGDHENVINFSNDGEIYYERGNVGINNSDGVSDCPDFCVCHVSNQCWEPSTLFEVVGTAHAKELTITQQLEVSDMRSTTDMQLTSQASMAFRTENNDIVFGRDDGVVDETTGSFKESMRITQESQWLIGGISSSEYLVDVGQRSLNPKTEFRIESDSGMSIELNRSDTDLSQKGHMMMDYLPTKPEVYLDSPLGYGFYTNDTTRSMTLDPDGFVGIFTDTPRNTLDVYGAMAISYEEKAPTDGLIVLNRVGVGMDEDELPVNELEVGGSVIIGDAFSTGTCDDFCIRGDGSYNLWIGGVPISTENVFVSKNISIKNGELLLREGADVAMSIVRDNGGPKIDEWTQLAANKGLTIHGTKDIFFKTAGESGWVTEMVVDSAGNGRLGIGTVPTEILHVKDDDNDALVKIRSGGVASVHFKHGNYQAMIGTNVQGFQFKTHVSSLDNPEMTLVANSIDSGTKVGFSKASPGDHYIVDVGGTINALDYVISDEFSENGYRSFQTVPTGVIVLWVQEDLPEGWAECGIGSALCPNMTGKYVKGSNATLTNVKSSGGSHTATLSSTTHTHSSASHTHKLDETNHSHTFNINWVNNGLSVAAHGADAYTVNSSTNNHHYLGNDSVLASGTGHHGHPATDFNHKHGKPDSNNLSHGSRHGNSGNNSHAHGANASASDSQTVGTGINARGTRGDAHKHDLNAPFIGNQPDSKYVRFIVKVDEFP